MPTLPFTSADILLPKTDPEKFATIACDQFTSEPEYWQEAERLVGDAPSCLRMTLPEVYLSEADLPERIEKINATMKRYLREGVFTEYKDALIYVERTLSDGRVRRGLVGAFALDAYDYTRGSEPMIRPTEGTVLSRIPPRVKIREGAVLEAPHIMILMDDRKRTVIEGIRTEGCQVVYDFDLMLGGGHLKGYLLSKEEQERIFTALSELMAADENPEHPLLFAVGDGNHSLATAKACARQMGGDGLALAELVNIHDPALDFEPIYRVVFGVDPKALLDAAAERFAGETEHPVTAVTAGGETSFAVNGLEADVLQAFLDAYAEAHPGTEIDYIHGEASLRALAERENAVGFLFGGIQKEELFPYVKKNGPLPRKTFSMGEARDKRYYMEARILK